MPRIAFVTNVLAHYRVPCFEALSARLGGQIDFFLLTETMAHRNYVMAQDSGTVAFQVLPGKALARPPHDDIHLNDPRPVLRNHSIIVMGGWAEPSYLLLWMLAQLSGRRIVFWLESTAYESERSAPKEKIKRLMLARASGIVAAGTRAAEYAQQLGVPPAKIFSAPNAINTAYFQAQARTLLPQRAAVRTELDLHGTVILFVGRMVEQFKNVSTLLQAQRILESKQPDAQLVLIGQGPDRTQYENTVRELNLKNVRLINFLDHDALCRYYAASDIFVLPSRSEPWGFVLNEAMEFGLPLVVSRAVGAAPDLVAPHENGFLFAPDDAPALAQHLETLLGDDALRTRMGARSREIIARFTPAAWAEGFARALESLRA